MAYDNELAGRVRAALATEPKVEERVMFGALAFMVDGHMAVGVLGLDLMVRVGPDAFGDALAMPYARVMDFTGRPSRGMVYVAPQGVATETDLAAWIGRGTAHVRTLPRRETAIRTPSR